MRTMTKLFWGSILIISLLVILGFTQSNADSEPSSGELQKVIAVVLDDSTSMVRDDPGRKEENYTTRWVEADYAIRALAAMMDNGDVLCIYPLNGTESFSVTIGKDDLEKALFNKLDEMGYHETTQFEQVREAAKDLQTVQGKECYLVVITDGNFLKEDSTVNMTQDELDGAFAAILTPEIQAHYIQIGDLGDKSCLPRVSNISVHQNVSNGGIIRQITDVINEIYHRVAMEDGDKAALITYPSDSSLTVEFNIPVQNVTVFLNGSEEWDNVQFSARGYTSDPTQISSKQPNFPALFQSKKEYCNVEWIKSAQLSGLVINFSAQAGFSREPITISGVPGVNKDNIQIYYEPAVVQKISISQPEGQSFDYGESDSIFVEGSIDIAVSYWDLEGNPLDPSAASMLKDESTSVEVNGRLFSRTRQSDGTYVYSGLLSADDVGSAITVSNAIGLEGGTRSIPLKEIYEPNMELTLELARDSSRLMLDEMGCTVLRVAIHDKASGTHPEWNSNVALECTSEHFNADVEHFIYQDGVIQIPLTLKDVEEDQIDPTERFTVKVSITYSDSVRPPASVEKVFPAVEIGSGPHELSVECEPISVKLIYVLISGKTFPVAYSCDDEKLSEEKLQNAVLSLELEDAALNELITLKDGNVWLNGRARKWFSVQNQDYEAELTFSYTKWNQPAQISVPITLSLSPITWQQVLLSIGAIIVLIGVIACLIWFILWYIICSKRKDDFIGRKTTFELIDRDDPSNITALSWHPCRRILFRAKFWGKRYARIKRSVSSEMTDGSLPATMVFYVAREGDRWELGKINTHMIPKLHECELRIGGVTVSSGNCLFLAGDGFQDRLTFCHLDDTHSWYLKITENE